MRLSTAGTAALSVVAGLAGAAVAYSATTGSPEPVAGPVVGPTAAPTRTVVRVLPCESGFVLKHGICLRTVTHRVVVPAPVDQVSARRPALVVTEPVVTEPRPAAVRPTRSQPTAESDDQQVEEQDQESDPVEHEAADD